MKTKLIWLIALVLFPSLTLAEIKLTKSADRSAAGPGQTITYMIQYKNTGPGDANNVKITDAIPIGTHYVPGSARFTSGSGVASYDPDKDTAIFTVTGAVGPGQGGSVSLQVTVDYTITGVNYGAYQVDTKSFGDTFMPGWSKDGELYTASNDTKGFEDGCLWPSDSDRGYDIAIHKLTGDPTRGDLHGNNIQCLGEYNSSEAKYCGRSSCPDPVPNWKSGNIISVDGVLYLPVFISEPAWGLPRYASIVKSTNKGATWCGPGLGCSPPSHDAGLFSDAGQDRFGAPYFIDYGRDPGLQGDPRWPDGARDYVYAISNNGFDVNANDLYLGRVPRDKLGNLSRADWKIVTDYTTNSSGKRIVTWGPVGGSAKAILGASVGDPVQGKLTWTTAQWIAPIQKYLMIQYRHAPCSGDASTGCYGSNSISSIETYWQLYQADHVGGPWTAVGQEHEWFPQGLYFPSIPTQFVDPQGVRCDVSGCRLDAWVLTSGDPLKDPQAYYHLGWLKMTLGLR